MFRALFSLSFTSKFNELVLQKEQMVDKFKNDASRASASDTSSQSAGFASRTPSKSPSVWDASGSLSLPPPSSKPSSGAESSTSAFGAAPGKSKSLTFLSLFDPGSPVGKKKINFDADAVLVNRGLGEDMEVEESQGASSAVLSEAEKDKESLRMILRDVFGDELKMYELMREVNDKNSDFWGFLLDDFSECLSESPPDLVSFSMIAVP